MISAFLLFFKSIKFLDILGQITAFILRFWREFLICLMLLLWQSEKSSHTRTASEFATFKLETIKLNKQIEAENQAELKARETITNKVVTSYAESQKQLKDYYEKNPNLKHVTIRVRDNASCSQSTTESESATGIDAGFDRTQEATAAESAREIQIDMPKATQEILQCLELIEFTKTQDGYQRTQ